MTGRDGLIVEYVASRADCLADAVNNVISVIARDGCVDEGCRLRTTTGRESSENVQAGATQLGPYFESENICTLVFQTWY